MSVREQLLGKILLTKSYSESKLLKETNFVANLALSLVLDYSDQIGNKEISLGGQVFDDMVEFKHSLKSRL